MAYFKRGRWYTQKGNRIYKFNTEEEAKAFEGIEESIEEPIEELIEQVVEQPELSEKPSNKRFSFFEF